MATRVRQQQHHHRERDEAPAAATAPARRTAREADLAHDLDDLLGEIDEVLEENAEEFVKAYVQKGGE